MKVTLKPGLWLILIVVFVLTVSATLPIWSFLRGQETRRAKTLLASASGSLQDRVQAELDLELNAIQAMAAKWRIRPNMTREEWEYDVRQILEEHPSLLSVAWIENEPAKARMTNPVALVREWKVQWSLPTVYEPAVIKLHNLVRENRLELLTSVAEQRRTRISDAILVADRGKAFAAYVPAVVDDKLKGALVGVFHLQVLMDFVFDRLLATDYSIQLMDGYEPIYQRGLPKNSSLDWEHQGTLKVFGTAWKMRLWPNPEAQRANEKLADLILLGGIGVAVLLTLLVYLAGRRSAAKPAILIPDAAENRRKMEERVRVWEATISSVDEAILVAEAEKVMGGGMVILFVNEALCRLTGFAAEELVGKSPKTLFQNDVADLLASTDERVRLWHKAQVAIDVAMRAKPIHDHQGSTTHWVVSFHRADAPAAVVAAPVAQLDQLIAAAPLPIQIFDLSGQILHWNRQAETVTGFRADEMVGHATPLGVQFPTPGYWTRQDLRIAHKNGKRLDLAVWTAPLNDGTGTKYMSFMADLTGEHLEQEKIAERETMFRALVDNASDILAILDVDSKIEYVNPAVRSLLGLEPAQWIGQPVSAIPPRLATQIQPIEGTPNWMMVARPVEEPAAGNALLDAIGDAILTYDSEHRVTWMNRAAEALYGFTAQSAVGKTLSEIQPDWLQVPAREQVFAEFDRQGFWKGEISNFTPAGREIVQEVSIATTGNGSVAIHRDITTKKSAMDALAADGKTRTLEALSSTEGLWDWNLRTDEVYFSPRWKEMLGYADEEITGDLGEWYMLVHPEDLALLRGRIAAYLKGAQDHVEVEYRARTRGGGYRWMMTRAIAMRNASGEPTRLVGLQSDIHDQKQLDEQLLFEAFHDSVTGLANRALFLDRLNGELSHPQGEFAVAFLDLKRFALVNAALGTRGGDKALAEAGKRIAECLPPGSFIARHGSDEFAAVIPSTDVAQLDSLAALIRLRLARPFAFDGKEIGFECSIGFAIQIDGRFADGEAMLQAASRAMANVAAPLEPVAISSFRPEQFRVFYHPVISLETGEICGMESLVRWQHPERGLLAPDQFLSDAESSGLILEIDRWVLREACRKVAELNQRFSLFLTVNLSNRHFENVHDVAVLEAIIRESGIDPAWLRIELNDESIPEHLSELPVVLNPVKLRPEMVRGIATGRNLEQVRSIIQHAGQRNQKVVAEGVESLEQLAALRELKCHFAQGFYFTRPAPAQDTERLLARGPRW